MADNVKDLTVHILTKILKELQTLSAEVRIQGTELKAIRLEHGAELKAHGADLKSIRTELVFMRRDAMKRATTTEVADLKRHVRTLEDRVSKVEKRIG